MKILWVKTNLLHPLDSGGTIRTFQLLRQLRREHTITYLTLQNGEESDAAARASEYCNRLVTVPWPGAPRRGSWRFLVQAVRNLFSTLPLPLHRYHVPALRRTLDELVSTETFDVVVCDFLFPALHFDVVHDTPTVLFQHNVESVIWERMADRARWPLKLYYRRQAARMRAWEGVLGRRFSRVIAVSREDAELFRARFGLSDVADVPTGVDTEYYAPNPDVATGPTVAFVGSLDWLPNTDAIEWMLDEIWPRVLARCPDATFRVIGRRPGAALRRRIAACAQAELHADVPDVRPYVWSASVVAVPLRVGSGTRLKIFEALACGKAVVSTPVGAEGLPLSDGTHAVLRSDAADFAEAITTLLTHPGTRRRLEEEGRALVVREHSWTQVAETFQALCAAATARPGTAGS